MPTLTGLDSVTDGTPTQSTGTDLTSIKTLSLRTGDSSFSVAQTLGTVTATTLDWTPTTNFKSATVGNPVSGMPLTPSIIAAGATPYQLLQSASDNADLYAANVTFLLQPTGAVGSQTFADSSSKNITLLTNQGGVEISDVQSKFNGKSIYYNGSNALVFELTNDNYFPAGTDYTIEFWAYMTGGEMHFTIGSYTGNASGALVPLYNAGSVVQQFTPSSSSSRDFQLAGTTTLNQWVHTALVMEAGTVSVYKDGVFQSSATWAGGSPAPEATMSRIFIGSGNFGSATPAFYGSGYIDQIRITGGVARYTEAFTPPIEPF